MKRAVSMGAMALLALGAFAPAAGAQEEVVDADAIIEEVQAEVAAESFFGDDFFADFLGDDFFAGLFGGFEADDDGGLTPEELAEGNMEEPAADNQYDPEGDEDAPSPEAATAGDGQYESEADDTGGLTDEERAEGNMDEPLSDNQPVGP